jgi:DNA mismatch repair protein MutS
MKEIQEINLTPLMKQYQQIKQQYKDCILMFRLGDFYEMFGEDAIKSSPILGVVLTKRQGVPMCGVPYHSVNNYISKLLNNGFKVAICEQVEDPKLAKGVVKREVVRVITPGTIIEENLLDAKKNNFLSSINFGSVKNKILIALANVDISTGDFLVTQFEDENFSKLIDELIRISPSEIVAKESQKEEIIKIVKQYKEIHIEFLEDWYFDVLTAEEKIKEYYKIYSLETFGLDITKHSLILSSIGGLLEYLNRTQKKLLPKLKGIKFYNLDDYLFMDSSCIRNLELTENLYDRTQKNTLLDVIDKTQTPQGARLLRNWLLKPLKDVKEINNRLLIVEIFFNDDTNRQKLREKLRSISDIERITNRITSKNVTPKDLLALKESLKLIPEIKTILQQIINSQFVLKSDEFYKIIDIPELEEVSKLIEDSIEPDAPTDIKKGGVIKKGFNKELDEIRELYSSSKEWLLNYQEEQRKKTQIQSLKVGYTSVFGYYIEVTKSNLHLIPKEYIRKQTLKNAERFTTPELQEFENKILSAEEKISSLEEYIFTSVVEQVAQFAEQLYEVSYKIALIDVFSNLAEVAKRNNYTKPIVDDSYVIELKSCRHPVVEQILPYGKFIQNDVYLDGDEVKLIILTGPNMAGKSTYIRQVALCAILAQIGSFVPAEYSRIGVVDKIFARIGAADYLAKGLSTFMVEMQETANILHNATDRSLIILDEVGRGTSTYDGISIAWAVIEYLVNKQNWPNKTHCPKTLFATHYFELTELEQRYTGIKNFNVAVKEYKDEIVFLYKVLPGPSDKSYGIHVAKLAGIPQKVINRASVLLKYLLNAAANIDKATKQKGIQLQLIPIEQQNGQEKKFFNEILVNLKKIDINKITPLDAFNLLLQWKKIIEQDIQGQNDENTNG